jgi:hypothetical protein
VNLWDEDSIDMLFDPKATSEANSIWQTRLTALGKETQGVVGEDTLNNVLYAQKRWARKIISGGYALELAVQWSAITSGNEEITPAADSVFGMAIYQHDNDGQAKRDASLMWAAVLLNDAYRTPKYLGTVKFLSNHKLQFLAQNNMTGVTNPVPYDGSDYTRTGVKEVPTLPAEFSLEQNYPNPFNPGTRISFSVSRPVEVRLEIFDMLGRSVRTFMKGQCSPGIHEVEWDGKDDNGRTVGSGIYLFVLSGGARSLSRKMIKLE